MSTPLAGLRVLEFEALGPVPHATALLAGLGADVVRVRRPTGSPGDPTPFHGRSLTLDLRSDEGVATALQLAARADVVLEGNRPGVMERLGLGPDVLLAENPRLIFGRMTGWGQDGPRASQAGHDINYLSATGVLAMLGSAERPIPPVNLLGDYGGGSMLLVIGILAALHERERSDRGQVVDAAIVDGVSALLATFYPAAAKGRWSPNREDNFIDGAAPFYRCYRCADGRFMAVGAIEPQFYAILVERLGLSELPDRNDRANWPQLCEVFATTFSTKTQSEWIEVFDGTDACVTPVRQLTDPDPHVTERGSVAADQTVLAAPRFSRSTVAPMGGAGSEKAVTADEVWT